MLYFIHLFMAKYFRTCITEYFVKEKCSMCSFNVRVALVSVINEQTVGRP